MKRRALAKTLVGILFASFVGSAVAGDPLLEQSKTITKQQKSAPKKPYQELTAAMENMDIRGALERYNKLHWVQRLPVTDLIMFENEDGDQMLLDSKARIAIRGKVEVFDMWNRRPIKSQKDAQMSWLVTLDTFNINPGDLASFRYGVMKDKPDVTVLVDPLGKYNKSLFDQMKKLGDKYSFEILLTPMISKESADESMKLWCAKDRELSLKELMSQQKSSGKVIPTCDRKPIVADIGLAGILRVEALPYLVRKDGVLRAGVPSKLSDWMEWDINNIGEVKVKK